MPVDVVLIANRGEIAARIARTVHATGRRSVAVFTDADARSPHVEACDAAVRIGSYLDAEEILRAAALTDADSVHPGYGFLSENAAFAQAVVGAGLTWIGPPPDAIELMGDKGRAKEAASAAGVPVVPEGTDGGFPVVVKAVAGGGGKGMRVVRAESELEEATAAAKREAMAAFGDDRVIIERYLERPRHIEVQVLADAHGHVLHLGERECSLQRRHQKVVEEAPSPVVDAEMRTRMGEAAVALAQACDYTGAGTVEFIAPADGSQFFFLEMNTRLQVEHPVTELVYGVDLVEQQLRVAAGERLALRQDEIVPQGHAIEARLYAEDPAAGFLPATGVLRRWREPSGDGVRVDSGVREGVEVGTAFDPMLAKVIAHGPDRATAIGRLDRALSGLEVLGVTTNAAFTRALLRREDVRAGVQDTGLLERILASDDDEATTVPADLLPAAAVAAAGSARPQGLWWRHVDEGEIHVDDGRVVLGEHAWEAELIRDLGDGDVLVEIDGVTRRYAAWWDDDLLLAARDGHQLATRTVRADRSGSSLPAGSLEAPMPGTVLQVRVADGDVVEEGDVLLVLESMKMELQVTAPWAGTVEGLSLREGDKVAVKQPLVAVVES